MSDLAPERIARDPSGDVPPSFHEDPAWAPVLDRMGNDRDASAAALLESWHTSHDAALAAWQAQVDADAAAQEAAAAAERARLAAAPVHIPPPDLAADKPEKKRLPPVSAGAAIGETPVLNPAPHVLKKLRDYEFVEFCQFTPEWCSDHAASANDSDQTFALTESNGALALLSTLSAKAKKSISDAKLSWDQVMLGKTTFLRVIAELGWPDEHVHAYARFYLKLDCHRLRGVEQGNDILVRYHAQARAEWHACVRTTADAVFDISVINEDRLRLIRADVTAEIAQRSIAQVCAFPALSSALADPVLPVLSPRFQRPFYSRHWCRSLLAHLPYGLAYAVHASSRRAPHPASRAPPALPLCGFPARVSLRFSRLALRSGSAPASCSKLPLSRPSASPHLRLLPRPRSLSDVPTSRARPRAFRPRFFAPTLRKLPSAHASPVWGRTSTSSATVHQPRLPTAPVPRAARAAGTPSSAPPRISVYASSGISPQAAATLSAPTAPPVIPSTSVLGAALPLTQRRSALFARKLNPCTPLCADGWALLLKASGLLARYPSIPSGLRGGFSIGVRPILSTFSPPNSATIAANFDKFLEIINKEFLCARYLGPFSSEELLSLLGPFQSSPLSLTPKPHKPGSLRLVQNLSFPHSPRFGVCSINSTIDAADYPCTWATFTAVCLLVHSLPPGSQAACRDIAEAFRTIPLHPSQWPGVVVRLSNSNDTFAVDTCNMFGGAASPGVHGHVADAGADLMRYTGIGPLVKWVDDHFFVRVPLDELQAYNAHRLAASARISGEHRSGGRLWFSGGALPDGRVEEFVENMAFPLRDLSTDSPRAPADARFSYCFADIDRLSATLGYVWNADKDLQFSSVCTFTGLDWDLDARTVAIGPAKRAKYLQAIAAFCASPTHALESIQRLYGKLMHCTAVIPAGRAYLVNLESAMATGTDRPFMPRHPPSGTRADMQWWQNRLGSPSLCRRRIPVPDFVYDPQAFSDASSGVGIGIVIGLRWRAWRLLPGWDCDGRDIGWAESIGFELLVRALLGLSLLHPHIRVYGDNTGVVDGWRKGSSRNRHVNAAFRRIHSMVDARTCTVHACYVASAVNPADAPSRGHYGSLSDLLDSVALPSELTSYLADFDAPCTPPELGAPRAPYAKSLEPARGSGQFDPGTADEWLLARELDDRLCA